MLTPEQNALLTQSGPGTPMGDLMRRYWQPVALAEELPPGDGPLPVRILGEDLVLFRDDGGRIGLLGLHCSHRGTDLSYGRVEDGGLRCIYHGWLFDVAGRCMEQPGEPVGSDFRDRVRHLAYPCVEAGRMILAYLGPGEPPKLPDLECFTAPIDHVYVTKYHQNCNYLQGNEGNLDPIHHSFLHRQLEGGRSPAHSTTARGTDVPEMVFYRGDTAPRVDVEETEFGCRLYSIRRGRPGQLFVKSWNFVLPNLSIIPGVTQPDGYGINWHVPIDDGHHWKYVLAYRRSGPVGDNPRDQSVGDVLPGYRLARSRENRFRQDRAEMNTDWWAGVGPSFAVHDTLATESQGVVQDRAAEHLGYGDKVIAGARRVLLNSLRDIAEGREPRFVLRGERDRGLADVIVSTVIPDTEDPRTFWKQELANWRG